ncbi:MAG: hypothetical protein ACI9C4_002239 [Paraglaciecola sp.]|jgi:hypothetical protein
MAIAALINQPEGYIGDPIDFILAGSGFRFLVHSTSPQFDYTIADNPAVCFVVEIYLNGVQQNY